MKKIISILLFTLAPIAVSATGAPDGYTVLVDRQPIHSTLGFSFTPPSSTDWYEKFGATGITFLKKTKPKKLSFYVGATEGKMRTKITTKDELLKFVKAKKDQWGKDKGRYQNITTKFVAAENISPLCTNYELLAEDHKAKNIGSNKFLILKTKGIFCLHPNNKKNAVDVYYSARYIPASDYGTLMQEGETFVKSLKFITIQYKTNKCITSHCS